MKGGQGLLTIGITGTSLIVTLYPRSPSSYSLPCFVMSSYSLPCFVMSSSPTLDETLCCHDKRTSWLDHEDALTTNPTGQ